MLVSNFFFCGIAKLFSHSAWKNIFLPQCNPVSHLTLCFHCYFSFMSHQLKPLLQLLYYFITGFQHLQKELMYTRQSLEFWGKKRVEKVIIQDNNLGKSVEIFLSTSLKIFCCVKEKHNLYYSVFALSECQKIKRSDIDQILADFHWISL